MVAHQSSDRYADFHIHIGRSQDRPVKMAASKHLTLAAVIDHAKRRKGLDVITVIDGVCDGPLAEWRQQVEQGELRLLPGGGFEHENGLVLIPGAEIEVGGPVGGAAHFGCWFPDLDSVDDFSAWLKTVQTNTALSSQRARTTAFHLQAEVVQRGGLFIVHHAFTPHKGIYGNCVSTLGQMVDKAHVHALELGLSADSDMADCVAELADVTFLSNSDAHSTGKIAREYNRIALDGLDFRHVAAALRREGGNRITGNFGLHPALGKYHLTICARCGEAWAADVGTCRCGSTRIVRGVMACVEAIATSTKPLHPASRPPYIAQIPLEFVPGLGAKTANALYEAFGTEMRILHDATIAELVAVVGEPLALAIEAARTGRAQVRAGAGGIYGRVWVP